MSDDKHCIELIDVLVKCVRKTSKVSWLKNRLREAKSLKAQGDK